MNYYTYTNYSIQVVPHTPTFFQGSPPQATFKNEMIS